MPRKKNKQEKETEGPFLKILFARISQQNNFRYKRSRIVLRKHQSQKKSMMMWKIRGIDVLVEVEERSRSKRTEDIVSNIKQILIEADGKTGVFSQWYLLLWNIT